MRTPTRALCTSVLAMTAAACSAAPWAPAEPAASKAREPTAVARQALTSYSVLSDSDKRTHLLNMLESFVPIAESTWDNTTFEASGPGVTYDRSQSGIAYVYATLLHAEPASQKSTFAGIPRSTLENHLAITLKYLTTTNSFNDKPSSQCPSGEWGGAMTYVPEGTTCQPTTAPYCLYNPNSGESCEADDQAGFVAFEMGWALQAAGDALIDGIVPGTSAAVQSLVIDQANTLLAPAMIPQWLRPEFPGDTHAEDDAWNSGVLAFAAAFLDPNTSNNVAWDHQAKNFAINASVRPDDASDTSTIVDGTPLNQWITIQNGNSTYNTENDYSVTNHNIFHPVYSQGVYQNMFDDAMFYEAAGALIPAAFSFRVKESWDNLLGLLSLSDGDLLMPAGTDWQTHDYQHIGYLAGLATRLGRDDASVLESRAILTLETRQTQNGGSFYGHNTQSNDAGFPAIGYETDVARTLAQAWWLHALFGPSSTPTQSAFNTATAAHNGVTWWNASNRKAMLNRTPNASVSMSWAEEGSTHPMALVVPSSENFLDDPVFTQYWQYSGPDITGTATYDCDCRPTQNFFSTAGIIANGPRNFSLTSWPDGSAAMLDQGEGNTFAFALEAAPGLVGPRPFHFVFGDASATSTATTYTSDWANADDRLGVVTRGGLGFSLQYNAITKDNILRNPNYVLKLNGDSSFRARGALILPLAGGQQTALSSVDFNLSTPSDANWALLSGRALDGTGRFAVARWGGADSMSAAMTSSLGAPIPDRPVDVVVGAGTGTTTFNLDGVCASGSSPCSTGFKGYFWVFSTSTITVHPISATVLRLTAGSSPATVIVQYVDGAGVLHQATNVVPANEVGFAHAIDQGIAVTVCSASSFNPSHDPSLAYDGNAGTNSYWMSSAVNFATSPQDITIDFGRPVDVGGVTMTPNANQGPKNYLVQTSSTGVAGSFTTAPGGSVTNASATAVTTTTFTSPVRARYLQLHVTATWGGSGSSQVVAIQEIVPNPPALDIDAVGPQYAGASTGNAQMFLAKGGFAQARVRVTNSGSAAASVTVSSSVTAPMTTSVVSPSTVSVPAGGTADVFVNVTGAGATPTTGTATLTVNAMSASGSLASEAIDLALTDDLAANKYGAVYPVASSSSEDPAWLYPARLANDVDQSSTSDFWVSGPNNLSTQPQCLVIDLGTSENVGRATMVPRTNYGPSAYTIETSTTGGSDCTSTTGWTVRASVASATNGTTTASTWTAVAARYVRLKATATFGSSGAAQQPQVRELLLYPN